MDFIEEYDAYVFARNCAPCFTFSMDEFDLLLAAPETAGHLDQIRECLNRAYREARDRFDPQIGCDNRTFGMEVYSFAWFRIQETKRFEVTENEPKWLTLNAFEVAVHRVPFGPIHSALPRDRGGWPSNAYGELAFPRQEGVTGKKMLVVAHMGSHEDGFQAAHLCVPSIIEGQLAGWQRTHTIWSKKPVVSRTVGPPDGRPQEEHKEKAKTIRRSKRKDEGGAPNDAE